MIRPNATVTLWRRRVGADAYGAPQFAAQAGTWRGLVEARSKRLVVGGRELVSTRRLHLAANPGIAAGDELTIGGEALTVLQVDTVEHPTLGHTTILLGPA